MKDKSALRKSKFREEITVIDWIIFAILACFCYFSMQQQDILHTAGSSFSILNGHILDFYEYNAQYMSLNNYMISSYILFALWNLPIYLLGVVTTPTMDVPYAVLMWYKALPTLCYFISTLVIYRIGKDVGFSTKKARIMAYAFAATPIGFFSQFCFGQYDIFTVLFVLLGIHFYFSKRKYDFLLFAVCFGVSFTFKYFSILLFVPLLLLRKKDITSILKYGCVAIAPILLFNLPYINSTYFRNGVAGFGAVGYIFSAKFDVGVGISVYIIPLLWVLTCVYAFVQGTEKKSQEEQFTIVNFCCCMVMFISFGLSMWHPQWLLLAVPFMTFSIFLSKRKDIICLLQFVLTIVFFGFVVNFWVDFVDQQLFGLGCFKDCFIPKMDMGIKMRNIYAFSDLNILYTMFSGVLLGCTVLSSPRFCMTKWEEATAKEVSWIRARSWCGILAFVIPMIICLVSALTATTYYNPKIVLEKTNGGSTLQITAYGVEDSQEVQFPTWSDENGQDDIIWYKATKDKSGVWVCDADVANHETSGRINVHAYADGELVALATIDMGT